MGRLYLRYMMNRELRDDTGATAAEYALIAALIAMVVIVAVITLGTNLFGLYEDTASSFADF